MTTAHLPPSDRPLVSVIIPHWRGWDILRRCLESLKLISYRQTDILLVDNGCDDGSVDKARQQFPNLRVISAVRNLGFAGGCNLGLREARGELVLLLNDDAAVTADFLEPLVAAMVGDRRIAACQPKILSIVEQQRFDYAGAAGGLMDALGFPFCRGRIFLTLEEDHAQYDQSQEIFWASGACCLLRMSAVRDVGFLDEGFFAHMEEIDLQWRMHLAGYHVAAVPTSVVLHQAGSSLSGDAPHKLYLNHRNGLIMVLKNYSVSRLSWIVPARILLDLLAFVFRLLRLEVAGAFSIFKSLGFVAVHMPSILTRRGESQAARRVPDREVMLAIYPRSIVWDYFVLGRKKFSDLHRNAGSASGHAGI